MDGPTRLMLGIATGILSALTFHEGVVALLHIVPTPALHMDQLPYAFDSVPPFYLPRLLQTCLWGALYGALFGLLHPRRGTAVWFNGFLIGLLAMAIDLLVVTPLTGGPFAANWVFSAWFRALLMDGAFGLGLGLIYPLITPKVA